MENLCKPSGENAFYFRQFNTLSAKGKQALDKLADVLAANENVEVDIVASAAYYNGGMVLLADKSGAME